MSDNAKDDDAALDDFFAAGRAAPFEPSPDFLTRVLGDAQTVQAGFAEAAPSAAPGWFATALAALGGWPTVAGLATATVAGVWIGVASPEMVDGLASGYLGISDRIELTDLMPSFDVFLQEG